MKTLIVTLLLAQIATACPTGFVEWQGSCAAEPAPAEVAPAVQASSEVPSRHPEPAWQRGEVTAIDLPSLAADHAKQDQEKSAADLAGKKAAGIE